MSDDNAPLTVNYEEMTASISSARSIIQQLQSKSVHHFPFQQNLTFEKYRSTDDSEGISLLSLKNQLLLNYIQSLLLLSCRRALGHTLSDRKPPSQPFSSLDRDARADGLGDLVDSMVQGRITLEKTKILQSRMRYQIDKLVRLAKDEDTLQVGQGSSFNNFFSLHVISTLSDPLAFRPNPENLIDNDEMAASDDEDNDRSDRQRGQAVPNDGLYHAPHLAPVPYIPTSSKEKRDKARAPVPTSLAALRDADQSLPYTESTSGMGSTPSLNAQSSRARYLKRLNDFEEEQFGRVMLGKKESRRRTRDEETLAMGGALSGIGEEGKGRIRRNRNLEDEFADVLRDVDRASGKRGNDGYDELRQRGKRGSVLDRSRKDPPEMPTEEAPEMGMKRKRSRFEQERKSIKKKK